MAGGFPLKRLNASSGNPTLSLTRYSEKGLKVIEVKGGPIAPLSGLIREWPRKGRCEEQTLLADILPSRRFDVAASQLVRGFIVSSLVDM